MVTPPRSRLGSLWLLLTRPGEWSARRYAEKTSMELTALHPERWPAAPAPPEGGGRDTIRPER